MDLTAIPWVQGSLVTLAIALIFATAGYVLKGQLVPRKNHDDLRADTAKLVADLRADTAKQVEDLRADRDARVAEANEDADEWRRLWSDERQAHETTRQAYAEEIRAALLASTEGAQIAAALLTEIKAARQIEAKP